MTSERESSHRLMRAATYASVAVASLLIASKVVAWLVTDSIAILSSLIDSFLDVGASLINMYAVRHALTPADREHRFGHGKAEALAGLAQAAFISGSALFLVLQAAERFVTPRVIDQGAFGISVMVFSIVMTAGLVAFQAFVVRKTSSVAISADSLHYKSDLLANVAVIVALVLSVQFGWLYADPLLAIAIAGMILWGAWRIIRDSLDQLMDRDLPDEQRMKIKEIAMAHPDVRNLHDLRTRTAGTQAFIQLHLELDPDLNILAAHTISDKVEAAILKSFPGAEIIIHQDPEGLDEGHADFS